MEKYLRPAFNEQQINGMRLILQYAMKSADPAIREWAMHLAAKFSKCPEEPKYKVVDESKPAEAWD